MGSNLLASKRSRQWLIIQGRLFAKPFAARAADASAWLRARILPEQQEHPGE
jgi:hypothetical protein